MPAAAALKFSDPIIARRVQEWTSSAFDEETRAEVQALVDGGDTKELEDRFYRTLEFGTGGLRGRLGAGTNRMNETVVGWATQGLANYVKQHATRRDSFRAAVAYDCRNCSPEFARRTACVFAANGFEVFVSPALRPTPYLSFAIARLGCQTGVVVTASHNPKDYNGFKCYWDDGSQVVIPHDEGIIAEVNKITSNDMVKAVSWDEGLARGWIKLMGDDMDRAYLDAIRAQRMDADRIARSPLRVVYTPLHGAGSTMGPQALRDWGFRHVFPVEEQMVVDGNFPTAASPNPEEGKALEPAVALAKKVNADLVLANDPDADRLGIAVKHRGEYVLLSGNQLAPLICDHVLTEGKHSARLPERPGVVTTVVTSPLFGQVAAGHGVPCPLVLTGFKWIARQIREWIASNGPTFVYGAEESYGFMIGSHCREKDGIVASCVVAEMAAAAAERGRTLLDRLNEIYAEHGPKYEWQKSITMPGREGAARIAGILERITQDPPRKFGQREVKQFRRLDTGEVLDGQTRAVVEKLDLPSSPVFIFDLADGSRGIVRPSGTEPKIKFYFFLAQPPKSGMTAEEAEKVVGELRAASSEFERTFLDTIGCGS